SVRTLKFIEVPTWDLYDDIIKCWFEQGRCRFRNLVAQFVQIITDRQFCCDLGNGIARCLGGQCGGARYPWVDLDCDDILLFIRTYRKLHVTSPCKIANASHHLDGHIPHTLKSTIG